MFCSAAMFIFNDHKQIVYWIKEIVYLENNNNVKNVLKYTNWQNLLLIINRFMQKQWF